MQHHSNALTSNTEQRETAYFTAHAQPQTLGSQTAADADARGRCAPSVAVGQQQQQQQRQRNYVSHPSPTPFRISRATPAACAALTPAFDSRDDFDLLLNLNSGADDARPPHPAMETAATAPSPQPPLPSEPPSTQAAIDRPPHQTPLPCSEAAGGTTAAQLHGQHTAAASFLLPPACHPPQQQEARASDSEPGPGLWQLHYSKLLSSHQHIRHKLRSTNKKMLKLQTDKEHLLHQLMGLDQALFHMHRVPRDWPGVQGQGQGLAHQGQRQGQSLGQGLGQVQGQASPPSSAAPNSSPHQHWNAAPGGMALGSSAGGWAPFPPGPGPGPGPSPMVYSPGAAGPGPGPGPSPMEYSSGAAPSGPAPPRCPAAPCEARQYCGTGSVRASEGQHQQHQQHQQQQAATEAPREQPAAAQPQECHSSGSSGLPCPFSDQQGYVLQGMGSLPPLPDEPQAAKPSEQGQGQGQRMDVDVDPGQPGELPKGNASIFPFSSFLASLPGSLLVAGPSMQILMQLLQTVASRKEQQQGGQEQGQGGPPLFNGAHAPAAAVEHRGTGLPPYNPPACTEGAPLQHPPAHPACPSSHSAPPGGLAGPGPAPCAAAAAAPSPAPHQLHWQQQQQQQQHMGKRARAHEGPDVNLALPQLKIPGLGRGPGQGQGQGGGAHYPPQQQCSPVQSSDSRDSGFSGSEAAVEALGAAEGGSAPRGCPWGWGGAAGVREAPQLSQSQVSSRGPGAGVAGRGSRRRAGSSCQASSVLSSAHRFPPPSSPAAWAAAGAPAPAPAWHSQSRFAHTYSAPAPYLLPHPAYASHPAAAGPPGQQQRAGRGRPRPARGGAAADLSQHQYSAALMMESSRSMYPMPSAAAGAGAGHGHGSRPLQGPQQLFLQGSFGGPPGGQQLFPQGGSPGSREGTPPHKKGGPKHKRQASRRATAAPPLPPQPAAGAAPQAHTGPGPGGAPHHHPGFYPHMAQFSAAL